MIIEATEEVFEEEESFEIEMSSENKTFKSSPLQEITNEVFIKQSMTHIPESTTSSNIITGHLLEINSDTT